jgi:hypothetical protein
VRRSVFVTVVLACIAVATAHPAGAVGSIILASHVAGTPLTAANGPSSNVVLSKDGRYAAYHSAASDIVNPFTDVNGVSATDVYLYDRVLDLTFLVSNSTASPSQSGSGRSTVLAISDDGVFVLLKSTATDLTTYTDNTPTGDDLFLWNRLTDAMTLITHTAASLTDGADTATDISAAMTPSGSHVVFNHGGSDLVDSFVDNNTTAEDLYMWEHATGEITLVSHQQGSPSGGGAGGGVVFPASLSDDGRRVVYASKATDLITPFFDVNGGSASDVYAFDATTGVNKLISHHSGDAAAGGNAASDRPVVSGNGAMIAYQSKATTLVQGFVDGNGGDLDVFFCSGATCANKLASRKAGKPKEGANLASQLPSTVTNGGLIFFLSGASNLIPGFVDGNGTNLTPGSTQKADIFVYARRTGGVALISRKTGTAKVSGNGEASLVWQTTPNGRFVFYGSVATDLVPGFVDQNAGLNDGFVFDRSTGKHKLVSHAHDGFVNGSDASYGFGDIGADGTTFAFSSAATNLVANVTDASNASDFDVFVSKRGA